MFRDETSRWVRALQNLDLTGNGPRTAQDASPPAPPPLAGLGRVGPPEKEEGGSLDTEEFDSDSIPPTIDDLCAEDCTCCEERAAKWRIAMWNRQRIYD